MRMRKMILILISLTFICTIMAVSGYMGISTGNSISPTTSTNNNPSLTQTTMPATIITLTPTSATAASQYSFSDGDNGNEVSLHKGDVFTVSLVQAMGSDYSWDASTSPGLTITNSQLKDSNTIGIAGLGNPSQVWTVEVMSGGSQWFKAENKGGTITIATNTLNIDVN